MNINEMWAPCRILNCWTCWLVKFNTLSQLVTYVYDMRLLRKHLIYILLLFMLCFIFVYLWFIWPLLFVFVRILFLLLATWLLAQHINKQELNWIKLNYYRIKLMVLVIMMVTVNGLYSFSDFDPSNPNHMTSGNYVVVDSDNREVSPLLPKNTPITLDYVSNCLYLVYFMALPASFFTFHLRMSSTISILN